MKRLFALILLASACFCLQAQDRLWDAALDQYQQICDECISIRSRAAAGEGVQLSSMTQILSRLSSLRKTLKEAEGQMTPAQRLRFESIRMRYEEVFGGHRNSIQLPPLPPLVGLAEFQKIIAPEPGRCIASFDGAPEQGPSVSPQIGALLLVGVPDLYYGALLRLSFGSKPLGAFVKASVSIPYTAAAYECRSDGTTADGYIWTSGKERLSRWALSAGVTVSPMKFLSFYAGGGYGSRTVLWEDVTGRWAGVSDLFASGFSADVGIIVSLSHRSLMAGVSTIAFSNLCPELGVGINF